MVWYGMVCYVMLWYGIVCSSILCTICGGPASSPGSPYYIIGASAGEVLDLHPSTYSSLYTWPITARFSWITSKLNQVYLIASFCCYFLLFVMFVYSQVAEVFVLGIPNVHV